MLRAATRPRGFALLIVLWTMVLLALLVSEITAAGRSEAELAANLRGGAVAEAAADGAEAIAIFHYLAPSGLRWPADGTWHRLRVGPAQVAVVITDEDGKVNPNTAPRDLLVALLRRIGVDAGAATRLAAAMVDWRSPGPMPSPGGAKTPQYRVAGMAWGPPGAPFQSTAETALVLGMTPAIAARLRPYLSIFTTGEVDPAAADPVVRAALEDANNGVLPSYAGGGGVRTLRVTARAVATDGSRFTRTSVVRIDPASGQRLTLAWGEAGG
jgi:general secretion pathway protein K